jgi:hypothetical protein
METNLAYEACILQRNPGYVQIMVFCFFAFDSSKQLIENIMNRSFLSKYFCNGFVLLQHSYR